MQDSPLILKMISNWFKRNFSDPEALGLLFFLFTTFMLFEFFGNILMPVLVSVVIAYLLNSLVLWLQNFRLPHAIAMWLVFLTFVGLLIIIVFAMLPLLWKQSSNLITELPAAFGHGQRWLNQLSREYPNILTGQAIQHAILILKQQSSKIGQVVLSYSLASISSIIEAIIYLILVPLLVFFFMKDGKGIASWLSRYLPTNRGMIQAVWCDLHQKIGAYVRGRVVEMILVAFVAVAAFALLKLQYAFLLGILLGISVIVPYIGAIVVTIPVLIIGLMEWGFSSHFGYLILTHVLIIALDANILFPLLFSETMDLHPIVIILSVLIFGGIWGFWGIFFAIPLASLVRAILRAWPQSHSIENNQSST